MDEQILSSLLELAERADDALLLLDRQWRFVYLNRQALAVARLPAEALIGRVIWEVYPSLVGTPVEIAYRRAMGERAASQFEHPGVVSGAWYDVRVYPVGVGIAVQGRDVSDVRRAERESRESNERFRALFDATSDAVVVHADGVVLEVNRSCCELFGYAAEDLIGRDGIALVFPPEARDGIRRLAADGHEGAYEAAMRRRDGSVLLAEVRGRTIDYNGRRARVVSNRDVTEQRRAADELRQSEHRFRQLAEAVDGVFFMVDLATERLLYVSPAYERLWGRSVQDLIERTDSFLDGVHPDDRARVRAALRPVRERGADLEYRVVRPDGSEIWVRDRTFPIRDAAGRVYRLGGIAEDVTERRRAADAMRAMNEELERRVAARTAELEARTRDLQASAAQLRESDRHHRELAEHNQWLARELAHRVGNNLAALLALVPLIRGQKADVDTFAAAVEARVRAMAHAHQVLTRSEWRAVGLRALVESALGVMGHMARNACTEVVDGPDLLVAPRQVLPLTLVLVELYTNSCKHGAHSGPGGRLDVTWDIGAGPDGDADGAQNVILRWAEQGGLPVVGRMRPSLGTQLVHGFVTRELAGRCELRFPPRGPTT